MAAIRNVLFIMCDQLRWDHMGCAGHPYLRTPHLDAFAKRSPDAQGAIDAAVAKLGVPRTSLVVVPVVGRLERGTALVDAASGKVLAVVPVDPY